MPDSQIRRKSLKAASWIYFGFLIGALNVYFFTHKSWFSVDEYGLTRSILDVSMLLSGIATFGVTSFLFKFFPYYKDNTEPKKNDLLGIAFKVAAIGFVLTSVSLWLFHPLIERKLSTNSGLLVEYIYYAIPMAGLILIFNILEAYSYGFHKGVLTSFLKEVAVRLFTLIAIILKVSGLIDFETFMQLFIFQYLGAVLILFFILKKEGSFWLHFKRSRVTDKYRKKIVAIMALTFLVIVVTVLRQSIDTMVLASKINLEAVGIVGFAAYLVSILQAPFRSMVAITIPVLSAAWKDKRIKDITRIYKRSSINLLTFSLCIFGCIWLNYDFAIDLFKLNPEYLIGKWVFFILGLVTIVEMGTGVNGQIIGTSTYWRFELWTSLLLTSIIIPLSYFLTIKFGILGPALANLISFSIYNAVRIRFLWKKFNMQPFNVKSLEVILITVLCYFVVYFTIGNKGGFLYMTASTLFFLLLFGVSLYIRNITPDLKPVLQSLKNRLKK